MQGELARIRFSKIMQTRAYTVVVVGNDDKQFAIYTEPRIGQMLQLYLSGGHNPRPLTHDLIGTLFDGLDIRIKQVVINDLEDTVYFGRLFIEQELDGLRHILEIDARPSDCLTLALLHDIPVYCTKEVLEKAVPLQD